MWDEIERQGCLYLKSGAKFDMKEHAHLRAYQRRMRAKPTYGEVRFRKILYQYFSLDPSKRTRRNKRFIMEQKIIMIKTANGQSKQYIVDFYLPTHHIVFEIDGDSHDNSRKRNYDAVRDYMLKQRGVTTIRIKNTTTKDVGRTRDIITDALRGQSTPPIAPVIAASIPRDKEKTLQADYIARHGVTKLKPSNHQTP